MNHITIQGRIVRDLEIEYTASDTAWMRVSVAVDRKYAKDGKRETDFFECVTFGRTAEFVNKYFQKGDGIILEGRMESTRWTDKDGNKRLSWSVTVGSVEFPIGKGRNSENNDSNGDTANRDVAPVNVSATEFKDYEDDGDLPF